jgi:selenocysteine-specific elongation factor
MRDHVASRLSLLTKSSFSAEEISAELERLAAEKQIFLRGDFVADAQWWRRAIERALGAIDAEHKAHPHHAGLDLTQLRNLFPNETAGMVEALVSDLCERDSVRVSDVIKRASHRPLLPPELQAAGARIRSALATKPFDPPSRKELTTDSVSRQALRFFLQTGEAVEINEDVVLGLDAFQKMRDAVIEFIRQRGMVRVGEVREALGSSRRVIVPFLELLDRQRVTQRTGDKRTLAG